MVSLRLTTREAVAPDGQPVIGRGYEARDAQGQPLSREALTPERFEQLAIVEVAPASPEERQALRTPGFALDRPVTLASEQGGVAVRDAQGEQRAGWVPAAHAEAVAALLAARGEEVVTWVCWEWLRDDGRTGADVAISLPQARPQRLGPPAPRQRSRLADRRAWLGLAAALVVVAVGFASCA